MNIEMANCTKWPEKIQSWLTKSILEERILQTTVFISFSSIDAYLCNLRSSQEARGSFVLLFFRAVQSVSSVSSIESIRKLAYVLSL